MSTLPHCDATVDPGNLSSQMTQVPQYMLILYNSLHKKVTYIPTMVFRITCPQLLLLVGVASEDIRNCPE